MPSRPTCPFCGASVSAKARYCDHCGTPLANNATTPSRRKEHRPGRIAVWAFLLTLLLVFGMGTVGGYRYRAGHWPFLPGASAAASTDPGMNGISVPQAKPDNSTVSGYLQSVVSVNVRGTTGNKAGSGFIMDSRGHVVTAAHVVEGASCVTVLDNNGRMHQGTVVERDRTADVALVRVPGLAGAPAFLEFGESAQLKPLADVYVLGNPKGLGNAIPLPAIVSQVHDQKSIDDHYFADLIQLGGAVVMDGTSGGPLVDKATGRVVGVIVAGSGGPLAWAMPADAVVGMLRQWTGLPTPAGAPCAPVPAASTSPVLLSTITPLSEVDGIDGADLASGALLAIRDMEESLRAAGYEVTLKMLDDKGSPALGREMADTAVANPKVVGVVGSLESQVTLAIADRLKASGIPMVAPTAGADELTSHGWHHFDRLVANSRREQQAAARFARNQLNARSVFVIQDGTPGGARELAAFEAAAQVIDLPVAGQYRTGSALNYPEMREKLLASKAGAIYYAGQGEMGYRIAQALRQDSISLPIIGSGALFDVRFRNLTGPGASGIYFTRLTAEPSQSFEKHFESVMGKPTRGYAAYGYDAASVILSALIRYGEAHPGQVPPRPELARLVRETKGYQGWTSWITFEPETGENKTSWVYVFEWKQGVPELLENMQ